MRRLAGSGVALLLPLLTGCAGDMSILDPAGPAARQLAWIWWVMLGVSTGVFVAVVALWLCAFRRGERPERDARDERRIARRWIIGGGIVLPGVSIVLLLAFGTPVGQLMLPLPGDERPLTVEVIGHQWWWEVRYPTVEGGEVVTSNQLMMPVAEPVDFHVTSDDVIHSFWVPRLGGKIDMLPGRTNRIRLEADHVGVFGAQCAEFCGTQHAHMRLHVEALEREDFEAWIAARQSPPVQQEGYDEARAVFVEQCADCHRVEGLSSGRFGPDLSDLGTRASLGAGTLPMREGAVAYWLENHQRLKPGNRMPGHAHLEPETLERIGAWLETLSP